jgi:outer membrane protein assembly factor BamB
MNRRYRRPLAMIAVTIAGVLILQHAPIPRFDEVKRNFMTLILVMVGSGAVAIWSFFRSGWPKVRVAIAGLLLILAGFGTLQLRHFDGDFLPVFGVRDWVARLVGRGADDLLEAHRQENISLAGPARLKEQPGDWPAFRNTKRDGVSPGADLATEWNDQTVRKIWRQPVGKGWSGFAVVGGFLITMEQRRDREVVACYQAKNGHEVWSNGWVGRFSEPLGGDGPRATPTVHEGKVYALGALGKLVCLDGANGQTLWSRDTIDAGENIMWALSGSPIIVGELVIVIIGGKAGTLRAFDRTTGADVWAAGSTPAGYSSSMAAAWAVTRSMPVSNSGINPGGRSRASTSLSRSSSTGTISSSLRAMASAVPGTA